MLDFVIRLITPPVVAIALYCSLRFVASRRIEALGIAVIVLAWLVIAAVWVVVRLVNTL